MKLTDIPAELTLLIFEHMTIDSLEKSACLCSLWRSIVYSKPVLAARIDVDRAIDIFNANGPLGIEFITKSIGMINDTPEDIARWLSLPGLDNRQIGKYLGDKKNKVVLQAAMNRKDFKGMHLDAALRKCLSSIGGPYGGWRVLKAFARRFCECNPGYFSEDAVESAYILSGAMIVLNRDAQSPQVQNKLTKQQFVAYVASSTHLKVKIPYLEGLYDRITADEIRIEPRDDSIAGWVRSAVNWMMTA
uniref:F-box domain-containing protein n=1 Tax=Eutreptiella gymnastica TaxID=73025 RepID=A0A7S1IQB9_9EUGL|mmetsp:Transcript_35324/g.63124  ORF Transcript_35324/g.63124 Transcript_35324/m.63124 type:complete len:247 (+) Transcript_35324:57-797(+)